MLEADYPSELDALLRTTPCGIELPARLRETMSRVGPLASIDGDRRRFARFHFAGKAILDLSTALVESPGRQLVLTLNLSRSGIRFLTASQLFPGDRGTLWLPTGQMACVVANCRREGDRCFSVGARFGEQLELDFKHLKLKAAATPR